MNMKIRVLIAGCLSLALTGIMLLTSCSQEVAYTPVETPAVTLPNLTDDRVIPNDVLSSYECSAGSTSWKRSNPIRDVKRNIPCIWKREATALAKARSAAHTDDALNRVSG